MPFIPHTDADLAAMLSTIGVESVEDLFAEIPEALRIRALDGVAPGMGEMEIGRLMGERAASDDGALNFIGAGAYEHHVPAAVWQIATRGEFYSAYTPYQAEASQGTLQLIYEYQTMMAGLMAMDVSNASLYDGASALAEAVLMAVRAQRSPGAHRILVPDTVHPAYRAATRAIVAAQGLELVSVPFDPRTGCTEVPVLDRFGGKDVAALVIPQPNFFGVLEDADALAGWAQQRGILVIGVVNPLLATVLKPPGEWGEGGADIACGEGQPLGVPLSSGGPYFGFLCSRKGLVRQVPGRLVGRTVDADGKPGFVLTLQAREQHIRRSKATSNICTNQGLVVTAATIHMALLGAEGLRRVAHTCYERTHRLIRRVERLPGVARSFEGEYFHEVALRLDRPAELVLERMAEQGILAGYPLASDYPERDCEFLVCATETKTDDDLEKFAQTLARALSVEPPA